MELIIIKPNICVALVQLAERFYFSPDCNQPAVPTKYVSEVCFTLCNGFIVFWFFFACVTLHDMMAIKSAGCVISVLQIICSLFSHTYTSSTFKQWSFFKILVQNVWLCLNWQSLVTMLLNQVRMSMLYPAIYLRICNIHYSGRKIPLFLEDPVICLVIWLAGKVCNVARSWQ